MAAAAALAALTITSTASADKSLRDRTYATDPCLAWIIDRENRGWEPTKDYIDGGPSNDHGNVSQSYGLPQANPGTKMVSAGSDWRTNAVTQLRWAKDYARKYGGTCGAKAFWQAHSWW